MPQDKNSAAKSRDAGQTRADILQAASVLFSKKGYSQVGLREVAAEAGITAALIVRYFGSKEALFEEALTAAMDLSELLSKSPQSFGRDMVDFIHRHSDNAANPLSMQLLAMGDPRARVVATKVLQQGVLKTLRYWLSHNMLPKTGAALEASAAEVAETKAALITTVLSGVWLYRDLYPLPTLSGELAPPVAAWLANTLQNIVDDPAL